MSKEQQEQPELQGISTEKKLLVTGAAIALGVACYVQGYTVATNNKSCPQTSQQVQGK